MPLPFVEEGETSENLTQSIHTPDCKFAGSGEGVGGKPTAATWPWFVLMDEVLGQKHSITPPVLIASIPENTPGPSTAVVEEKEEERQRGPQSRQRKRELLDLLKEDLRFQREAEERRAQESRERMERLFSILERIADK
ncbi:unnamed protein product [Boreogadus saida]